MRLSVRDKWGAYLGACDAPESVKRSTHIMYDVNGFREFPIGQFAIGSFEDLSIILEEKHMRYADKLPGWRPAVPPGSVGTFFGYNFVVAKATPKMQLSLDVPLPDDFRHEFNKWMEEFFGYDCLVREDEILLLNEDTLYVHPKTYQHIMRLRMGLASS